MIGKIDIVIRNSIVLPHVMSSSPAEPAKVTHPNPRIRHLLRDLLCLLD